MNQCSLHTSVWGSKAGFPLLLCTLLAACGSDSNNSGNSAAEIETPIGDGEASFTNLNVNAASYEDWQYISLSTGEVLTLDAAAAAVSTDWHIALRRNEVMLNGGTSGPGAVRAALVDAQDEFYDANGVADASVFTNADADIESAALAVPYEMTELSWQSDANEAALADWYVYDFNTHTISAAPDVGFLVRHADGVTYSRVQLTSATYSTLAASYDMQAAGTDTLDGVERNLSGDFADGETFLCFDLDTVSTVDCSTAEAEWDLMYEVNTTARAINLWTNGGVYGSGEGASLGMLETSELDTYSSATNVGGYDMSTHYSADSSTGLFGEQSWYAYNLVGEHKLWPNFRTYLIDLDGESGDATPYTLQIADYYSLGDSGSPQLRFQPLVSE